MSTIEELVEQLKQERLKFTQSNDVVMQELVDALVQRNFYPAEPTPAMTRNNTTILQMVNNYGVNWNEYYKPHNCAYCGTDLRDTESGPPFKREIGIYDLSKDCVSKWRCPDCKEEWDR